jgi:DNA-binding NtrC family response regulator
MGSANPELQLLVHTAGSSRTYPLPAVGGAAIVGRSAQSDICVEDPAVSRKHLSIHVLSSSEVEVQDLGSANGTVLLGGSSHPPPGGEDTLSRISERRVEPHKPIRMGVGGSLRIGSVLLFIDQRNRDPVATIRPPGEAPADRKNAWSPIMLDQEMRRLYALAARAAVSDITVLILGETGVGKEVLAESIHRSSPRAARPFLRLNCAALPENLLESELFGHERGAFTGANQTKVGLLESTNGGTVFLDEVGELPVSIQVKLLRVLEERIVLRVGSTKPRPINVRFITATNRDLKQDVERGIFRGDLYFRINGVTLRIPPLRERKIEIEPLARYFLEQFCVRAGVPVPEFTREAMAKMLDYEWPGNVRELRNVMERASFLCGDGPILDEHIPPDIAPRVTTEVLMPADWATEVTDVFDQQTLESASRAGSNGVDGEDDDRERIEVDSSLPPLGEGERAEELNRILRALAQCGGNQTRAAKMLGVSRRTLVNRLDEFNLPRPRKGR